MPLDATVQLSDADIEAIRKNCLKHFFVFCRTVMGYDDIIEELHGELCRFLELPGGRKQVELPRSFVKTWTCTIAYSIWITLPRTAPDEFPVAAIRPSRASTAPDAPPPSFPTTPFATLPGHDSWEVDSFYLLGPNLRILIASYVIGNAMKMINLIRKTYERNQALQILFPEVIPDNFAKVKWSDTEACINRSENYTESTFEAGGIGGSTTSRHYDLIIEDDLIYANKDDFSGRELQPSQEDIDKAIGWHKLAMSLLVPGPHTRIHNVGTRWAKHDLIDYIRANEPDYVVFKRSATKDATLEGEPEWPQMYGTAKLKQIYAAQGPYMFATQYLGKPMAPEDMLFKQVWLQYYTAVESIPKDALIVTTTDLSTWSEAVKKKSTLSRGVVLTCAWDKKNHVWILRYDVGRFDPSKIIDLWYVHNRLFAPNVIGVEEVYYQASVAHFAHKRMETEGWLPLRHLKTNTHIDKHLRIRGLEPYGSNGAVHCRPDHKDFIMEWSEYVPGANNTTVDILDALAYQLQVARPGSVEEDEKEVKDRQRASYKDYQFKVNMDDVVEEMRHPSTEKEDIFAGVREPQPILSPEDEAEFLDLMEPLEIFR